MVLKGVLALLALAVVGVGAFLIGSSSAPTRADATTARRTAFTQSYREARASAEEASRSRGQVVGRSLGLRTGQHDGLTQGEQAGASAAEQVVAAQSPPPVVGTPESGVDFSSIPACNGTGPGICPD